MPDFHCAVRFVGHGGSRFGVFKPDWALGSVDLMDPFVCRDFATRKVWTKKCPKRMANTRSVRVFSGVSSTMA